VTVRVTTLKGPDAGMYYVDQLPKYYLHSGEPRGIWLGLGAGMLELSGTVADQSFLDLMAGLDPRTPTRHLGLEYDEKRSVRGFDVTASAPKSVSILFAIGHADVRREVLDAHDAAVRAMAGWIERHAHTRFRTGGGPPRVVDAEGIVAAAFRQHTSRALDPQLHTHLVIANRVKSPDGRWLALDARSLKRDQRTLSALYHAGLRAELTRRLGVEWREPVNGIAEIANVPDDLLAEFSGRTVDIERRLDEKLDRFVQTMERDPTARERWRLEREGVIDSRPAKSPDVDADALHERWADQVLATDRRPEGVVADAIGQVRVRCACPDHATSMFVEQAMANLSDSQSTWRPAELVRELAAVLPTRTAETAERVVAWAEDQALVAEHSVCVDISRPIPPEAPRRKDGRPTTEAATDRALTTEGILYQEEQLLEWADRHIDYEPREAPEAVARSRMPLNVAQAEAAAAVAGHADLVLVVGPAGAGKTMSLTPAVENLRVTGRPVLGVAPSANAADVLANETGVAADTIDKLPIEHRLDRRPDHRYDLPPGATVIVDEAGMVSTGKLAELADLAERRSWRIALVGDPRQFSSVGRGGMFGLLVDTFGAIEFEEFRRFDEPWESEASLLLRRGDVEVVDRYVEHDRLHGGNLLSMERSSVER
jgi:conjugative relaxase-like TrwC/TraI family protein